MKNIEEKIEEKQEKKLVKELNSKELEESLVI